MSWVAIIGAAFSHKRRRNGLTRLVLAAVSAADALVSGDGDIQAVREQCHIPVLTVAAFADGLQTR